MYRRHAPLSCARWLAENDRQEIGEHIRSESIVISYSSIATLKTNIYSDTATKLVRLHVLLMVLHTSHWGFFDPIDTPDNT